jgi:hypothetical protein
LEIFGFEGISVDKIVQKKIGEEKVTVIKIKIGKI